MPNTDYPQVIEEDPKELEKRHRYSHLFHRVKMLRLLKSEECSNLRERQPKPSDTAGVTVPEVVHHLSPGGFQKELLVSRVHERGPAELVTQEAFEELEAAMKRGEIATVAQAHEFLLEKGVHYTLTPKVSEVFLGVSR